MQSRSKKVVLIIFLFSIFAFLLLFIFVESYTHLRSGTTYSKNTTEELLDCTFSFRINNMEYENNELVFDLKTDDVEWRELVIGQDGVTTTVTLDGLYSEEQVITVKDIELKENFTMYPMGCEPHNKKKCSLTNMECRII